MLTGELRGQIDSIWNAFWSGGISNPMEVLEQITYLLFIRRLDDAHTLEESKASGVEHQLSLSLLTDLWSRPNVSIFHVLEYQPTSA